jgi:phosphate transport system substrate-binding protein
VLFRSGVGIQEFIKKTIDIAQASRQMKATEIQQAKDAGLNPVELKVAVDGIAIIVHQNNPLHNLTMEQLRGIYNGTYTNWNQVGGSNKAIVTFGRQSTSGTYQYFQEVVLNKGAYIGSMQQMTGNAAIISGVQGDDRAIGYVGIGYAKESSGISVLNLKKDASSSAYAPTDKNAVLSGHYALSRPLYLYTNGVHQDGVWIWLNWILDANAGQKVAEQAGFYALPHDTLEQQRAKLVL